MNCKVESIKKHDLNLTILKMRLSYGTITLMNIYKRYNMWSIKEIKQKGKKTLKNNLWTLLLIGLFMTIVVGKYAVNNVSLSNLNVL